MASLLQAIFDWWAETLRGFWNMHYRRTQPKYHPLPDSITRTYIKTAANDPLELLVCEPAQRPSHRSPPVLFMHGGFGHASVWLPWLTYLHAHGYGGTLYAVSARGHGASYKPSSWFRMVWLTGHDDIARDLVAAYDAVVAREDGVEPILVGHSAGGELSQYVLAKGMVARTPALGLIGTVPHFGTNVVFDNWYRVDPWIHIRGLMYLQHPKGPLATTRMVHRVFFGPDTPLESTEEFARWAADYEAMGWPLGSMGKKRGGRYEWLDVRDIVRRVDVDEKGGRDKVLVLIGTEDKLMEGTTERIVDDYKAALAEDAATAGHKAAAGVRHVEIKRAGHHVQNDVQWEEGAEALLRFLEQV